MASRIEKVQKSADTAINGNCAVRKNTKKADNLPELIANTSSANKQATHFDEKSFFEEHKLGITIGAIALGTLVFFAVRNSATAAKFFEKIKNKVKVSGTSAKASEVGALKPIATKGTNILTLEEKLCQIKGKFGLTEEDIRNPILRENIDKFYEYMMDERYRSVFRMLQDRLKTVKLTFSGDAFRYVDLNNVPKSAIGRAMHKNYPMEIIEYAGKAEKTMPRMLKMEPELKLESDIKYGASIMDWYQKTFENSGAVNNSLRKSAPLSDKAKEVVSFFDSHQRQLGQNTTLIRGTNHAGEFKAGDIISDKGYMSCTTRNGFIYNVDDFGGPFVKHQNFLIIKTSGKQKAIVPSDWTGADSMGERILPRGTKLRVIETHPLTDYGNFSGKHIIEGRKAIICEIVE
ncbi:MAG: hypothetical protein K6A44_04765 [bacterium]|nr:hypothetical protein [bacterium]